MGKVKKGWMTSGVRDCCPWWDARYRGRVIDLKEDAVQLLHKCGSKSWINSRQDKVDYEDEGSR